jgi:hypothetical protein
MRTRGLRMSGLALSASLLSASACGLQAPTYTLYRNSPTDRGARAHVATFDARESEFYNRENCALAQRLFQEWAGQDKARYWCEKGPYQP